MPSCHEAGDGAVVPVTCTRVGPAVVCRPSDRFLRRRIIRCPFEERQQEMVIRFEEWYGPTVYCCGCGDSWSDGELMPRPFYRGWRHDQARRHRRLWDRATYGPAIMPDEFRVGA